MNPIVETICEAGRTSRRLRVVYCGTAPAGVETVKIVEPYKFLASGNSLQLWCWSSDPERGTGFRTLNIARMTSAEVTQEPFDPVLAVTLDSERPTPNPNCRERQRLNRPGRYSGVLVCPTGFRFNGAEQHRLLSLGFELQDRLTSDGDLLV